MITAKHLTQLGVPVDIAPSWADALSGAMIRYDIADTPREAAFIAQLIHESNGLRSLSENLNYTPAALMRTFNTATRTRFPKILADQFGRIDGVHSANQAMIANIAYAGRMGNGGVDSGDGWRYRGRGPIQLTGRSNYMRCGEAIGVDLIRDPDKLTGPVIGARAAGWFWNEGNKTGKTLNKYADAGQIDSISRAINGGDNGLEHRRSLYEQALRVLA